MSTALHQPAHARLRAARAGFVLPVVMLLVIVAGAVISLILARLGDMRRAVERQTETYRFHHTTAGLQEMLAFWTTLYQRSPAWDRNDAVMGFDLVLDDGARMEVRLEDAQGMLKLNNTAADPGVAATLNTAASLLQARGRAEESFRWRGPSRLSLQSAPPDVLEALVAAVSKDSDPASFSSAVMSRRSQGRLRAADIRELSTTARIDDVSRHRLEASLTTDPQVWRVTATAYDAAGNVFARQAGVALGAIKPEGAFGGVASWTILSWGSADDPGSTDGLGSPTGDSREKERTR